MKTIYFDNAATGIPSENAIKSFIDASASYGNPSSLHGEGMKAMEKLAAARASVAKSLFCAEDELYFTGCGSESNNIAVFGSARARERFSKRIVISDSEHPSIYEPVCELGKRGWEVVFVGTRGGKLDLDALRDALSVPTALVAVMQVNNETGAHYDLRSVRSIIDLSGCGAYFHCDAVQGYQKTDDRREIRKYCDTASFSAHKIGGLKGVGALYVKSGTRLSPLLLGGGQERGLRPGTENLPGICAFAAAAEDFSPEETKKLSSLHDLTRKRISELMKEKAVFHIPESHVGAVLSVSVPGVRSEVMLNALSAEGICVSAGSACSSKKKLSRVLASYGLSGAELESAVRISFGMQNTPEECEILAEAMNKIAQRLVK